VVAWAGVKWIPGFDLRGPFLVQSPYFSVALFFILVGSWTIRAHATPVEGGRDKEMIEAVAAEFGFGAVTVARQNTCDNLRLILTTKDGRSYALPKEWNQWEASAKRFAIVRELAPRKESRFKSFLSTLPKHIFLMVGMVVAGINLWTILGYHALTAVYAAYKTVKGQDVAELRKDVKALRIMKDLHAAASYVRQVPSERCGFPIDTDKRIVALRQEAARLGIA